MAARIPLRKVAGLSGTHLAGNELTKLKSRGEYFRWDS